MTRCRRRGATNNSNNNNNSDNDKERANNVGSSPVSSGMKFNDCDLAGRTLFAAATATIRATTTTPHCRVRCKAKYGRRPPSSGATSSALPSQSQEQNEINERVRRRFACAPCLEHLSAPPTLSRPRHAHSRHLVLKPTNISATILFPFLLMLVGGVLGSSGGWPALDVPAQQPEQQYPAAITTVQVPASAHYAAASPAFRGPPLPPYAGIFPRRRSSAGGEMGAMQSRAVDTSAQFEVLEGQGRGTVVGYIPTKPEFTYRFNEPPREFLLDPVTGEIRTSLALDREERERYDLVVLSSQPTYPIEVRITVLDVNDNAPEFPEASIAVSFSESAAPGTRLLLDAATDRDSEANGVTDDYRIVDGNQEEKFRLATTTNPSGDVSYLHMETTGNLDREACGFYQLNVSARDGGNPPKYGYLQVNVSIVDVNDNPPVFERSDYAVSLNESVPPGTDVLQVLAMDSDLGDNGKITYYLADTETQFTVDPETGVITTTELLNCPQQNCPTRATRRGSACPKSCVFTVFARDHGSPRQDGRTYVTVNLVDTNDHDPVIRFQYFSPTANFATVDENAANDSVVAAIAVVDLDEGANGDTSIRIVGGNELAHFRLDAFDIVRVNGVLDREEISKYNLTVVAIDKGVPARTSTAHLIIHVNDVNDHDPVFEKSEYSAVLSELAPLGSYVASITATDEDTGVNALIHYDFVTGNEQKWFAIDSASGLITTRAALDREVQDSVELSISARDGGPNPKWAYTTLKVTVLDENDEAPQFARATINVSLSESSATQTLVAMLTAMDHDQGTNGSVTYALAASVERAYPQQFALDTLTGQLTTRRPLDRETIAEYVVHVVARDQGTPPQSATATVFVHVEDVNDNSPRFYPKRYFYALDDEQQQQAAAGGAEGAGGSGADGGVGGEGIVGRGKHQAQAQHPLLTVRASDRDAGDNALITYTLESGGDGLFAVDAWSGAISLHSGSAGDIRQSRGGLHRLRIAAKDRGGRQSEEDAVVEIVWQSKMQTLEFDATPPYATYEFDILEDHDGVGGGGGRAVGRVQVKSLIMGRAGTGMATKSTTTLPAGIEYAIVYGDAGENFAIDARSGQISTAQPIDRETQAHYQLQVIAVARGGGSGNPGGGGIAYAFGKCLVNITIGDLNDNAPIFAQDRDVVEAAQLSLPENAAVGQELYLSRAFDRDAGANSRLTYTITYNPHDQFRIGAANGVLYLQRPVREAPGTRLQVELMAIDGGESPLSTKHTISVVIEDVNDHTPVFDHTSYETSLLETTKVNERFFALAATDADLGANGRIAYDIVEGNVEERFGIFPDGYLFVRAALDREERDYYALTVACRDAGTPSRSSHVPVIVHVIDENDNAPQFTNTSFTFSIAENEPADAFVGKLTATDRDIGRNAELIYVLVPSSGGAPLHFSVDSRNGFIKTLHPFDREELVQRRRGPLLLGIAGGAATGMAGASAVAVDDAAGTSNSNGQNVLQLEAIVYDNGLQRLHDKVKVKIIVTDVNDNAPQFLRAPYRVQISEGASVGTQLMRVYTVDADEGLNGDVYYSLVAGNQEERFALDDATGQLTLAKSVDRERKGVYRLTVVARDAPARREQQLTTNTTITVELLDENDVAPQFVQMPTDIAVLEMSSIGTELVRFRATDADLGVNSQVTFSITAGNRRDTFHIDAISGSLYLHKALDYEDTTVYQLNITASDGGTPRLATTIVFTVQVVDENDNAPSFPNTAIVRQIKEGIANNTPIVTITAEDPDSGTNGKITYSIARQEPESSGGGSHFGINAVSGVIYTLREIDRERIDTFRLTVVATDQAQAPEPRLSAEKLVTVIVEDINDNAPIFVSMNAAILQLNEQGGAIAATKQPRHGHHRGGGGRGDAANSDAAMVVMYVEARDADSSSNGLVTYELVSGDIELFKLHRNTGAISLRKPIAAAGVGSGAQVRYRLALKATDEAVQSERKSSDAYITLIAPGTEGGGTGGPLFDQHEQSGSVYENAPPGTSILTVSARLSAAEIEYYVTNVTAVGGYGRAWASNASTFGAAAPSSGSSAVARQVERLFDIDTKLGILSTATELDRELGPDTYEVEVYAIALGGPPRTSSTKVKVVVLDKNDSPPVFQDTPLAFNVSEDLGSGHYIATIRASDPDTLGTLTYTLISGDGDGDEASAGDGKFLLEPDTGKLRLKDSLDRETKDRYKLRLRVSDGVQYTETTADILVTDTNDNPPVFDELVYSFDIPENAPRGYQVGVISATDPDLDQNAVVSYSVISDWANDVFSLNPQTGVFTLTARLDYEEVQHYIIEVQAQDNGHPGLSNTVTVYCNVLDLNDNAPIFDPINYANEVYENVTIGTALVTVIATDIDSGDNGRLEYTITSGDDDDDLEITSNGTIRTRRELDRERKSSYNLIVTARDCAQEFPTAAASPDASSFDGSAAGRIEDDVQQQRLPTLQQRQRHQRQQRKQAPRRQRQHRQHQHFLDQQQLLQQQQLQQLQLQQPQQRLSATVQVTIIVRDVNDEAPRFVSPNETAVLENIAVNTVVMAVKAIDRDEGRNGYIEYLLIGISGAGAVEGSTAHHPQQHNSPPFTLGSVDGLLRVSGRLDRESRSTYVLNITARDRGEPAQSTDTQITVRILDENDNSPVFDPRQYSASIAENASIGAMVLQVSATDVDEGANGRVRFSIAAGDSNRDFSISEDSGVVRVAKNLNYERKSRYALTVRVEDCAGDVGASALGMVIEPRYDTAELTIIITDINDNPPTFLDSPYYAYVMENVMPPNGGYFLTVAAFDADMPPLNSQVGYFLKEGDTDLFRINGTSGEISLLHALDREAQAEYTLTLVAMDKGSPPLTGTGIVRLTVQDANDHSPEFERSAYQAQVQENLPAGTRILQPTATDRDAGVNAELRFALYGEKSERFVVHAATGEIRTAQRLDREDTPIYQLILVAQDSSPIEARSTTVNVTISVLDVNDNAPAFEAASFNVNVPDRIAAGEFVFGARAHDADEGRNAQIVYNISGKDVDKFVVNAQTGVIKTRAALGGATANAADLVYSIVMHATDQGPSQTHSSMADLTVLLRPAGQFPTFSYMANTQFMLSEDVLEGKVITKMLATSPKKGSAANVRFAIAGGSIGGEAVRIDPGTGVVSIGKDGLDYEKAHQYEIWIEAADSDRPSLRSVILLTINVTDVNDNAPIMEQTVYSAMIPEEEPALFVLKVMATDLDSGDNGEISYRLLDDHEGSFEIYSDSGSIFTTHSLDREEMASYELIVEAVDQGMPQLTGVASVLVQLLDKNDNPPKFTRLYSVNVTENADVGSFVIRVTSSDLDEGPNANATYSFTENPGEKFKIDAISGNITVAGHLDREEQDEYLLKIVASDGAWRQETPITITIQDQNDNSPEFEQSFYSFNFPELQRAVAFVGQVIANDHDKQGPNSIISYSLQQPSDLFTIDPATGEIFSKRTIKYKHTQTLELSPENMYSMIVLATDNGKPPMYAECLVNINIVDANNNLPKFEQAEYLSPVPEHAKSGLRIARVHAVDALDYGINAEIEYAISGGNSSGYFAINPHDGWLALMKPLTGLRPGTVFSLILKATDHGVPPQSDEAQATIVVAGENRFTPEFTALSYQVIVPENEPIGSTILTVTASDRDEGPNGMLRYTISSGNERREFEVNAVTGAVTILQPLDYDLIQEYHLNITVQDLAFKPKQAVAMLTVILTDINDNPPLFNQSEYDAFIAENRPPETFIFRARATDKDSAKNAIIRYSITGGTGRYQFKINANTGDLVSSVIFDYEERREYSLQIMAANPDSSMHSTALVTVHITGVNEFYPQFVQPVFHFDVSESAEVGTAVGAIQATDKDAGEDGQVYYLLIGASNDKGFAINRQTGVLRVARHLDREEQSRVVLTVMAKNYGGIRGNDTDEAQVIITIQDGNDPPEFLQTLYSASVSEAAAIGTKVLAVKAVDKDVRQQNNQFTYSIVDGNTNQTFKIDPETGEIQTARVLDREQVAVYELTVAAIDSGVPPQTGTTLVRMELLDVNDNGPTFAANGLIGYVAENEPAGTSIMTLMASDPDLPPNGGPFTYALIGGKHKSLLTVDKHTGLVKSTRSFDREQLPVLEALIEVEDSGQPRQRAQHTLRIRILDQNDSPSTPRVVHVIVNAFNQRVPVGKVADVHPNDADTTGDYDCRIEPSAQSSQPGAFAIPGACDLHTTIATQLSSYAYTVSGNDGKHGNVLSTVTIGFQFFDNETVASAAAILVRGMTAEHFLAAFYRSFVELVKGQLEVGSELKLFSIRNVGPANATADAELAAVEIMLAVRSADSEAFHPSRLVVERLNRKREALEMLLQSPDRVIIGYNPCAAADACENGGMCTADVRVLAAAVGHRTEAPLNIVDSPALVFSGPTVLHESSCRCPGDYTGAQCTQPQNPCAPNPCQAKAQCRRNGPEFQCLCPPQREGKLCQLERGDVCSGQPCRNGGSCRRSADGAAFFCLCRPGYRGNACEHLADSCRPNPCLHEGQCVAMKPGYKCSCSDGRYGRHCERSTFGFQELSYMAFPALDTATNDVTIVFATTKPDALLAYNYGAQTGGRSDFIAIEVVKGKAFFSFGGARTAITTVVVGSGSPSDSLADGKWHKVTATRNGRVMSLSVARCKENGDLCEECRPGDASCYSDDVGPIGTLNFNKQPLLIGGLAIADPVLERPGQIHTDDLVGCVHSVHVNGRALNLSAPLKQRGVLPTCSRNTNGGGPCQRSAPADPALSLCGTFGACMDRWHSAMCQCGGALLSPDCFSSLEAITVLDGGFVEFQISEKHRRMQLLDNLYSGNSVWSYDVLRRRRYSDGRSADNLTALAQIGDPPKTLSLLFRTFKADGLLLFAATNKHYTALELRGGRLAYHSKQGGGGGGSVNMSAPQPEHLNDGKWHNVTLHATNRVLRLLLDGGRVGEELDFAGVHDFLDPYLTVLSVGGVRREHFTPEAHVSYEGCIANFTINNEIQPFNGSGSVFSEVVSRGKVMAGCADDVGGIGAAQVADPLSIGITLVIVFFVILVVAIIGSYVIYRFRGQQEKIGSLSCGVPGFKIKHSGAMLGGGGANSSAASASQNQADHVVARGVHGGDAAVGYHGDNGDLIRGVPGHHLVGPELIAKKYKEREIGGPADHQQRPQRPDIIEREVVGKSPALRDDHHPSIPPPSQSHHPHEHGGSVDLSSEYLEHYDLENASSIAPSDIDIVYHYKGYREAGAGVRKYKATPAPVASYTTHHKHQSAATQQQHRHSPRHGVVAPFVTRVPPQASQPPPPPQTSTPRPHQSTPLARLSPSSEMSSQQPRILTLHDISGKPLQSALLATTSSSGGVGKDALHSNSERSLNSPVMSQLSGQSSSASRQKTGGVPPPQTPSQATMGLTAEEIERLNVRPRTSSLVSTLDAVSSSSEAPRGPGGPHHLSSLGGGMHSADVDAHSSTSTDESGNDSFTCSEIEYDNNSLSGDTKFPTSKSAMSDERGGGRGSRHSGADSVGVVGNSSGLGGKAPPIPPPHSYDGFDSSFRGSLSTLVASDDDLSTHMGGSSAGGGPGGRYRSPNGTSVSPSASTLGWDYLLNWGPNFESLMGVFKDIAELPDSISEQQQQQQQQQRLIPPTPSNGQKVPEEYV